MQQLHGKAQEWRWFLLAVRAADECKSGSAVTESSFVDGEALLFPVIGFNNAITDGLLEKVDGVLVMDCGAAVAAGVEEAFGVCLMGHYEREGGSGYSMGECCCSMWSKPCHTMR